MSTSVARASDPLRYKTNVHPVIFRPNEATAEDFQELGFIIENHADKLELLLPELYRGDLLGFFASLELLIATYPTAPLDSFAIITDGNGNPLQFAFYQNYQWVLADNSATIQFYNTRSDFPLIGTVGIWYIATFTRQAWLWHNNSYLQLGGSSLPPAHTIIHSVSLVGGILTLPELDYVAEAVQNQGPFAAQLGQIIDFRTITPRGSNAVAIRYYRFLKNVTSVGNNTPPLTGKDFMPDGDEHVLSIEEIENANLIAELGDIGIGPVETAFNLGTWDMYQFRFVRATLNGIVTFWAFIGEETTYGVGFIDAEAEDFFNITDQPETPPNPYAKFSNLLDVDFTGVQVGDVFHWDGSKMVPAAPIGGGSSGPDIDPDTDIYNNVIALIANQNDQTEGELYYVTDASGFTVVTSGGALVLYLGTVLGTEEDYLILSQSAPYSVPTLDEVLAEGDTATDRQIILQGIGGDPYSLLDSGQVSLLNGVNGITFSYNSIFLNTRTYLYPNGENGDRIALLGYTSRKEIKTVSGDTYQLLDDDRHVILHFTSATDVTITVPTGLTSGNRYEGKQMGDGQLIFIDDTTTVINFGASDTNKTAEKYSVFGLDCTDTDEYVLFGKLELV